MVAKNIRWQPDLVGRARREALAGHHGVVLWLTGLSGAGKTTVARGVEEALVDRGLRAYTLDAENVRHGLNADLGFSPEDRAEHIRRLGEVAKIFADAATICIVACIAPYREARAKIRQRIGADFLEIHVATPLAVCEERDPRGLYARARRGEIPNFTGVSAPYEAPLDAELELHTEGRPVAACVDEIVAFLEARDLIPIASDEG
ncbi:MAG: adenylyl-sulfate kinase [Deltaproteobacteria bacterium]|nr:adenylyl-sulfate kinase [Deltaproteobacteria bacterium]